MTRVLLVDDHAAFRQPLAFLLERDPDFDLPAQAGSVTEARHKLQHIDVAVIDGDLPDGDAVELVAAVRQANPGGRILFLTWEHSGGDGGRALEAGANAILDKSASLAKLIDSARHLAQER